MAGYTSGVSGRGDPTGIRLAAVSDLDPVHGLGDIELVAFAAS